jgi:Family of unknown function (DUF6607)
MTSPHRHAIAVAYLVALAAFLAGCATNANYPWDRAKANKAAAEAEEAAEVSASKKDFDKDRRAILAMAGNYHVTFSFRETVPFVAGYTLKKPTLTQGDDVVRVIKDDKHMISLQHTLVSRDGATERWRQDWVYEPKEIIAFVGHNTWDRRELSGSERRGKWAQLVYEADDEPRYASIGRWVHENGASSWTAAPTWRPLPQRDAATRSDYDVILCVNREAITPAGWVEEEDNTKLVLRGTPQALVREVGLNTYTRN